MPQIDQGSGSAWPPPISYAERCQPGYWGLESFDQIPELSQEPRPQHRYMIDIEGSGAVSRLVRRNAGIAPHRLLPFGTLLEDDTPAGEGIGFVAIKERLFLKDHIPKKSLRNMINGSYLPEPRLMGESQALSPVAEADMNRAPHAYLGLPGSHQDEEAVYIKGVVWGVARGGRGLFRTRVVLEGCAVEGEGEEGTEYVDNIDWHDGTIEVGRTSAVQSVGKLTLVGVQRYTEAGTYYEKGLRRRMPTPAWGSSVVDWGGLSPTR